MRENQYNNPQFPHTWNPYLFGENHNLMFINQLITLDPSPTLKISIEVLKRAKHPAQLVEAPGKDRMENDWITPASMILYVAAA